MAPFKIFLGASVVVAFFLKRYAEAYMPSRNSAVTALEIFVVETVIWLAWRCLLYPILFSPLRAIPGPAVCPLHVLLSMIFQA